MKTIGVFGDSISYGFQDTEGLGWSMRLRRYLQMNTDDMRLYDCSISGGNINHLLERFKTEVEHRRPDIILIAIGINDSQEVDTVDNFAVDLITFKNNLVELSKQAKEFTENVIFIGLVKTDEDGTNPCKWNKRKFYKNKNIKIYDDKIKEVCKENNLKYIHMFDLLEKKDLDGSLHPNTQGHIKMFEKIRDEIKEINIRGDQRMKINNGGKK